MGRPKIYTDEEWPAHIKEYMRRYYQEHKEEHRAASRKYEAANAEEVARRKREWYRNNPDYQRKYHADKTNKAKILVKTAKWRAKKAGIPHSITWQDIEIPDICPVLGIPIELNLGHGFHGRSPSIDRIIPALGYVPGNVRVISYRANAIKRDATAAELRAIADYIDRETAQIAA